MTNFNSSRYINYAKWDLTINRKFYTNMFIVLAAGVLSVVLVSFMLRWGAYEIISAGEDANILLDNRLWRTTMYVLAVGMIGIEIMSGCLLHPLRNKQGRITNLTLPATSLEKFAWHFTICIGGTIVALLAATAVCDGLNALASYFAFGSEYTGSILGELFTRNFFSAQNMFTAMIPVGSSEFDGAFTMAASENVPLQFMLGFFSIFGWVFICGLIFETGLYAIFNSFIYKYNIPITYVLRQVASILLSVIIMAVVFCIGFHMEHNGDVSDEQVVDFFSNLKGWIIGYNILSAVCGIGMWIGSYYLYKKAQISSKFNK